MFLDKKKNFDILYFCCFLYCFVDWYCCGTSWSVNWRVEDKECFAQLTTMVSLEHLLFHLVLELLHGRVRSSDALNTNPGLKAIVILISLFKTVNFFLNILWNFRLVRIKTCVNNFGLALLCFEQPGLVVLYKPRFLKKRLYSRFLSFV